MTGVLSAEWLKLRSVRSTHYLLAAAALMVGAAALLTLARVHAWENLTPRARAGGGGGMTEETTLQFAQLLGGVLGVLAFTSEFGTGLIRSTFTAVPRRPVVLLAKTIVVAGASALLAAAVTFGSYGLSELIVGDRMPAYEPSFTERLPLLAALAGSVVLVALIGLGLGAVLRSAVGAIAILIMLLFVGQMVTMFLPVPWNDRVFSVLPVHLPEQLAGIPPHIRTGPAGDPAPHTMLSAPGAYAVAAAHLLATLGAAYAAVTRRDVR